LGNYRFRGDKLDLINLRLLNSECLLFRGDELNITVNEKLNSILGTNPFKGDKLGTLNSEFAARGSHINLTASPLETARVNQIWDLLVSEMTNWT